MPNTISYLSKAKSDAQDTAINFLDEIVEHLLQTGGEISDDLNNDYENGDAYHHENHVDKWYGLLEAANLLDELSEYEETDNGLWEGQEPRKAIATQAAYTYGQAVWSLWSDLVKEIMADGDLADLMADYAVADTNDDEESKTAFAGHIKVRVKAIIDAYA